MYEYESRWLDALKADQVAADQWQICRQLQRSVTGVEGLIAFTPYSAFRLDCDMVNSSRYLGSSPLRESGV
jgi:hypothetical protein